MPRLKALLPALPLIMLMMGGCNSRMTYQVSYIPELGVRRVDVRGGDLVGLNSLTSYEQTRVELTPFIPGQPATDDDPGFEDIQPTYGPWSTAKLLAHGNGPAPLPALAGAAADMGAAALLRPDETNIHGVSGSEADADANAYSDATARSKSLADARAKAVAKARASARAKAIAKARADARAKARASALNKRGKKRS